MRNIPGCAMPDYNPDREGHSGHKWIVQNALQSTPLESVTTSKGELKFDAEGRCAVSDPALANEIRTQYPHEVAVTRVRHNHPSDRGHRYFFSMPEMPWKRKAREQEAEHEER